MARTPQDIQNMAVFCDFENVALGVEEARYDKFDIGLVLERLLLKGSIVVKKAYCDWQRYRQFKPAMHHASFELIEVPHLRQSGKNSADIRLVVDALDLCYTKGHVDTFVIISGDSDFSPLVSKLRENNKTVIGVGVKKSTSDLLIANCDEFIFYDDLVRVLEKPPARRSSRARAPAVSAKGAEPKTAEMKATEARATEAKVAESKTAGARKPGTKASRRKPAVEEAAAAPAAEAPAPEAQAIEAGVAEGAEAQAAEAKPTRRASASKTRGRKAAGARGKTEAAVAQAAEAAEQALAGESAEPVAADEGPQPAEPLPPEDDAERRLRKAMDLIVTTVEALLVERDEGDKIWGSMVKQTLKRRNPGFSESYYGYRSFNALLEEAQARGLLELDSDEKSGGYVVRLAR